MNDQLIRVAIAYDFDGTLARGNMQEYDFIPKLNMRSDEFWNAVRAMAKEHEMDEILAYMYLMLEEARKQRISVHKDNFRSFGEKIVLFPGVSDYFARINAYAATRGIELDHYVISSGLREMVAGTPIAKEFRKIYASGFMFDHNDVACWPALAVNYTTKTQFIFRINKGSLEVHDNTQINKYLAMDKRPVPFAHMVFIGDGETDIPCMRLVKELGGHSIAVYDAANPQHAKHARELLDNGRATIIAPADYSEDATIDRAIKAILDQIEAANRVKKVAS